MNAARGWVRRAASVAFVVLAASAGTQVRADNAGAPHQGSNLATANGEQVYKQICQGCHMPDGKGAVGAGHYPAFAGNPTMASSSYMALVILGGRRDMPSFMAHPASKGFFAQATLTDVQVAGVINYIRTHFGNHYTDAITADEVRALHPALSEP